MDNITSEQVPPRVKDIRGIKFGRLTPLAFNGYASNGSAIWKCTCSCGGSTEISAKNITRGNPHCGCRSGVGTHPLYMTWANMMRRCYNPEEVTFHLYGARGIKVCERWHESDVFFRDIGPKPSSEYTLDRKDGSKDYCPDNCRWATITEQNNNRRGVHKTIFEGQEISICQLADKFSVSRDKLKNKIMVDGMSAQDALAGLIQQ